MKLGREHFSSDFAAVLAMAGSAIGLGNIWRFPYMTGQNGGAAFILIYIVCVFFLALPIFFAESVIGRTTQSNTFGAIRKIAPGSRLKWLGLLTVITPLVILSYYSVVGGWSVEYLFVSICSGFDEDVSSFFNEFTSSGVGPLACHTVFLLLTAFIVLEGVKSGIEKFNKVSIPVLFVLMLVIVAYSVTLPGSGPGISYMIRPDFSQITPRTFAYAMGQGFFSLSLGVGTVLTYSSYMGGRCGIVRAGIWTAVFDLTFAIIAGFAIMPAVFAAGIEPGAGPGLIFETLPYIFVKMGSGSAIISRAVAVLFFLTIVVAALTSSISMYEVGVAYLTEEKKMSRKKAVIVIFAFTWVLGAVCSVFSGAFSFCDSLTSNFLMTFGALLFVYLAGWKMDKSLVRKELYPAYSFVRYAAPPAIIAIFVTNFII